MAGKKGKKGKKGKRGKKKAAKEPQMMPEEAILAYQINVTEQKLEDVSYEIQGWEDKNRRNLERNKLLKQEQEVLIQNLLKANRDASKLLPGQEESTKESVTEFMKETWSRKKEREKELIELRRKIAATVAETQTLAKEVSKWKGFQETGQHKLQVEIKLLEEELQDMETSFEDMAVRLTKDKERTTNKIEKETEVALSQQKDKASERAMALLDKRDRQEMLDNSWLNREVAIHRVETEKTHRLAEMLEKENLEIMSDLFECSVEDLKVSRSFFLTQFADSENLDNSCMLEMDLTKIYVPSDEQFEQQVSQHIPCRPKSATQKAVEDKVFSLASYRISADDSLEAANEEETDEDSQSGFYENYFFEEENFEDYLQLGPLELKLLSVSGHKMPIHKVEPPSEQEMESKNWNPDQWPVTQPMLKGPLLPESLSLAVTAQVVQ